MLEPKARLPVFNDVPLLYYTGQTNGKLGVSGLAFYISLVLIQQTLATQSNKQTLQCDMLPGNRVFHLKRIC